jgi:trigger factor
MFITIVAADNDITVTADEINSTGNDLASYYSYNDYQEILDTYGNSMNAEVGYEVLYQKVIEFLSDKAVEVEG